MVRYLVSIAENLREIAPTWDDAPQPETPPEPPLLSDEDIAAILPTLVPDSDKRPAINNASSEFNDK